MPLYEFRCDACAETFTRLISWDRRGDVRCPHCGGAVRQLLSTFRTAGSQSGGESSGGGCCGGSCG